MRSSTSGRRAWLEYAVLRRCSILCGAIVVCDTMFFAALDAAASPTTRTSSSSRRRAPAALQAAYPLGVLVGSIPSGYVAAGSVSKPTAVMALLVIAGTSVIFGYADRSSRSTSRASSRASAVRSRGPLRSPG